MLKELRIEGFKLLKDVQIKPHKGYNVITGETGAGKSLVLGALRFLFGAKGGDELFAKGEETVKVSASLKIPSESPAMERLISDGIIEPGEDEIHLERWKERDGRSRIFIGGRRANLPVIKIISETMVDFLEQHHASRLTEKSAIEVLDSLGDKRHLDIVSSVSDSFKKWSKLKSELKEKENRLAELKERRELMEFQLKELQDAKLVKGELDDLTNELQLLSGANELRENAYQAYSLLTGDSDEEISIQDLLAQVVKLIEPLAAIDKEWASRLGELSDSEELIQDISRELVSQAETIQDDPERLREVENRIALIEKLKRKYGCNLNGLIDLREKLALDVDDIQTGDENLAKLRSDVHSALDEWNKYAEVLSKSRKQLAKKIEKELKHHLEDLELPNARVSFKFESDVRTEPASNGSDRIELMLSTNPSEDLRPLNVVASGGEATRITLALKALWAEREGVPVLVLDEGDIGIGGDTAYKVGEKFRQLAESHQLIVVSHLAQVAAYADMHFRVEKKESKKRAGITVDVIQDEDRIVELARMISGSREIESSLALAKSLLEGNLTEGGATR